MPGDNPIALTGLLVLMVIALLISLSIIRRQSEHIRALVGGEVKPRRFRWRIFWLCTLLSAACIAAIWMLIPPQYRAETFLRVESPFPKIPFQLVQAPVPQDVSARFMAEQIVLLKDDQVCREVLTDSAVTSTDWYRHQPDRSRMLEDLKHSITAEPVPNANYLRVSFVAGAPDDAAVIVNTLVDKYLHKIKNIMELGYSSEVEEYRQMEKVLAEKLDRVRKEQERLLTQTSETAETQSENATRYNSRVPTAAVARLNDDEKLLIDEFNKVRSYLYQLSMIIGDHNKLRVHRIGVALAPLTPDHHRQASLTILVLLLPVLGLVLGYIRAR